MKKDILGVKIDDVKMDEALGQIEKWIWNPGKHYIVTPNLEFILAAQKDPEFKRILNSADLAIPDSSSLGFSYWLLGKKRLIRLFLWPLFFLPVKQLIPFDRVSGTDLMEALCKLAAEKGFVTGFLGGKDGVAKKAAECLKKKYPELKVAFADSGGLVDNGGMNASFSNNGSTSLTTGLRDSSLITQNDKKELHSILPVDILFVAFGHIKQEKWIADNLKKNPAHVAIGVGGAFDYLSGSVPRAPKWMRSLGFEWLYRLIIQPWRIKRQLALFQYVWLLLSSR